MKRSRRAFVAGTVAAWSGCVGVGSSTPEAERRRPETVQRTPPPSGEADATPDCTRDPPSGSLDGTFTVAPGAFVAAVALSNSSTACGGVVRYDVSVRGDTPVDCLVFEREAWGAYVDGARDASFVSRYSQTDVTDATAAHQLDRGQYLFAVDYTSVATPPGDEPVTVDVRVES